MIELVKKSSGAVELDKHATQIITTAYVDEQIDKVEADIIALNDKVVENTMAINEVNFELSGALEGLGNYVNDKFDAMGEEIVNKFTEYDEELIPEIAGVLENHEERIVEIENTLPTIGGKNEFEFILSGETTEALQEFKLNKEKGYNFELCDFIWIFVEVPDTSTKTIRLSVWLNDALIQVNNGIYKEQARANKIIAFYNGLGWDYLTATCGLGTEYASTQTKMKAFYEYDNNISEITIGCYNKGDMVPANTKYLIYGRRVKK